MKTRPQTHAASLLPDGLRRFETAIRLTAFAVRRLSRSIAFSALCALILSSARATPSASRSFGSSCVSSSQCHTTTLEIDPGPEPPFAMIVREVLPAGWEVASATWNDDPITTNPDGATKRWAFSELGEPVATGTLVYVTCPTAAVEPSYVISGEMVFDSTNVATTGDSVLVSCDTDDDGMPNDWENGNFANGPTGTVASADDDGDGAVNLHEYHARTDPGDPLSFFAFTAVEAPTNGFLRFRWRAALDSAVELVSLSDLTANASTQFIYYAEHVTEDEKQSPNIPMSSDETGFFRLLLFNGR